MGLFDPDTSRAAINTTAHYPPCNDPLCGTASICHHCIDLWETWWGNAEHDWHIKIGRSMQ